jgi:hypothetical protein
MFNLEEQISCWRRQMLSGGIKSPGLLEELESHLRDDIEQRMRSGISEQDALEATIRQIGPAKALRTEFAKVRESVMERLKGLFCALAGIPQPQLATNMNTSNQTVEPGWATYLKTAAFIVPSFLVLGGMMVFVLPRLKEVCAATNQPLWGPLITILNVLDLIKGNSLALTATVLGALVLLERSRAWPRYRRLIFGVVAYVCTILAMFVITSLAVMAVVAGSHLLYGK